MGRALLVEVNHEAYSTNLLKLDKIGDMPVRVCPLEPELLQRSSQVQTSSDWPDKWGYGLRPEHVMAEWRRTSSERGKQGHHKQG